MCMMCDEEARYLDFLAYLHALKMQKQAAGEDHAEIDRILTEHGYVNSGSADATAPAAPAPKAGPTSPFSCDPA